MKLFITARPENVRKVCLEAENLFHTSQIPEKISTDIVLSLDEALTNVIEHGYTEENLKTSRISIEIYIKAAKIDIIIRDNARTFDISKVVETSKQGYLESGQIGGFGISIIRKLMTNVRSMHLDSHNILWMSKIIKRPSESVPNFISTKTADAHVQEGILIIRTHPGAVIDIEDAREQLDKYFRLIRHHPDQTAHAMLIDTKGMTMLTKAARQYYTELPQSGIVAIAIVIDSVFARWVANLFISFNRDLDQEIKMFNSENDARIWLEGFSKNGEIEEDSFLNIKSV